MQIHLSRQLGDWLLQQLADGVAIQDIRAELLRRGAGSEAIIDRLCGNLLDNGIKLRQALDRQAHDQAFAASPTAAVAQVPASTNSSPGFHPLHPLPGARANHIDLDGHRARVTARSDSPHAVVLDGVLTADECRQLIASAEGRLQRAMVIDGQLGGDRIDARRTSELVSFQLGETGLIEAIERRIARLTGIPLAHGEGLQVMRYGEGGEYQPHFDHFNPEERGEAMHLAHGGQRVATLVMYLNDVEEGGETVFPEAGFTVVPGLGRAVYFAYTDAASRCDPRAFHGGAPVRRGEKWIATKWFREQAYVRGQPASPRQK